MKNTLQSHLGLKLLISYLAIILLAAVVMILTTEAALPQSFNRHMMDMMGTPVPAESGGRGMGPGMGMGYGPQENPQLFLNFRAGVTEAMLLAVAISSLAALLVSLLFSRSIVAPLQQMTRASQRIAAGHYAERVEISGQDEIAQLGGQFNQMAEELEQVEAMRRRLIGDVSHELRTPLTAIKGYMEGLLDGVLPAAPETYQQIHSEAERLSRLVDDLQELSRVEAGAFHLDVVPVSFSSLMETTAKRLLPHLQQKNITLKAALPPELPPLRADGDRVTQILTNLLSNAIQYSPSGGVVTVSAALTGAELRISVADTGIGIPPENLPHIFDRFYRVDKSRSRQAGGGSGIGLTIAKALVEAQGGKIWAESAGAGQGSVFSFTLPLA
ncbi:MAG: ATP-binding protein [Anaerolineales bacterium]